MPLAEEKILIFNLIITTPRNLGKNYLCIASTASLFELKLITTDVANALIMRINCDWQFLLNNATFAGLETNTKWNLLPN